MVPMFNSMFLLRNVQNETQSDVYNIPTELIPEKYQNKIFPYAIHNWCLHCIIFPIVIDVIDVVIRVNVSFTMTNRLLFHEFIVQEC